MIKKPGKKDMILEAGLDAFFERGFDNTTIDEIVKRAGCGKGTFYRYFEHKDALLEELENNFSQNLTAELKKNCTDDLPVKAYLLAGLKTFMKMFKQHQRLGLVKFEKENRLAKEDRQKSACKAIPNLFYMRSYLEKAAVEKKIRCVGTEMIITLLLGTGHFLLFRDFKLGIPYTESELETAVDIILKGVLPQ